MAFYLPAVEEFSACSADNAGGSVLPWRRRLADLLPLSLRGKGHGIRPDARPVARGDKGALACGERKRFLRRSGQGRPRGALPMRRRAEVGQLSILRSLA